MSMWDVGLSEKSVVRLGIQQQMQMEWVCVLVVLNINKWGQ